MKAHFLLLILLLLNFGPNLFSQCNVKQDLRDDGTTIKYIGPVPIGHDGDIVAALGLETNGRDYFVTLWIVYTKTAKKATGILILNFDNNTSIRLAIFNSQKTVLKGMNATISTYAVKPSGLNQIKIGSLKSIGFQQLDGTLRVVPAEEYETILAVDYNCLSQ